MNEILNPVEVFLQDLQAAKLKAKETIKCKKRIYKPQPVSEVAVVTKSGTKFSRAPLELYWVIQYPTKENPTMVIANMVNRYYQNREDVWQFPTTLTRIPLEYIEVLSISNSFVIGFSKEKLL